MAGLCGRRRRGVSRGHRRLRDWRHDRRGGPVPGPRRRDRSTGSRSASVRAAPAQAAPVPARRLRAARPMLLRCRRRSRISATTTGRSTTFPACRRVPPSPPCRPNRICRTGEPTDDEKRILLTNYADAQNGQSAPAADDNKAKVDQLFAMINGIFPAPAPAARQPSRRFPPPAARRRPAAS